MTKEETGTRNKARQVKESLEYIAREIFQTGLTTYLTVVVLETLKSGFVSNFFNPDILLAVVLVSGAIMTVLENGPGEGREKSWPKEEDKNMWQYIWAVSSSAQIIVFYKTAYLGRTAVVLSLAAFAATAAAGFWLYHDSE